MKVSNKKLGTLLEQYKSISLLNKVIALQDWDMQVNMPKKGAPGRAEQIGYLTELVVDKWLDPSFKKLVEELEHEPLSNPIEKAMVRNVVQMGELFFRVPKKLLVARAQIASQAVTVWQEARARKNFALFQPSLEKVVQLTQEIAVYLNPSQDPYDNLLELYEPGLTSKQVDSVFSAIVNPLTELHRKLIEEQKPKKKYVGTFPIEKQAKLAHFLMDTMGFDREAGRLDQSAHPFCTTLDRYDERITTKYHEDDMQNSLLSVMHETGHALYDMGIPYEFNDTPLDQAASYGIHESQSRFWENQIGRSPAFIKFLQPHLVEFFPEFFKDFSDDDYIKYFNQTDTTPIRIDSDEVAYNLHIYLRYQIEHDLINKKIRVNELPERWNVLSKELLDITPKDDSVGILQDIHWSGGNIGYFPTYTFGNLYAAQLFSKLKKDMDITKDISEGNLKPILDWLRKSIHQEANKYLPGDLIKKATGEELNPQYFLEYIHKKYG